MTSCTVLVKPIKDRDHLANQFQEMQTRVMEASERRKRYMLDQCISMTATPVVVDPRLTALYKESASLVGFVAQKNELVNWAVDNDKQLKVMAIVGHGGLGKTTLANEVYRQVEGQFNCKALVCVSQKPNITKLLKGILIELGLLEYSHDCFVEQDLVNALRKHLQDKRYLVILLYLILYNQNQVIHSYLK